MVTLCRCSTRTCSYAIRRRGTCSPARWPGPSCPSRSAPRPQPRDSRPRPGAVSLPGPVPLPVPGPVVVPVSRPRPPTHPRPPTRPLPRPNCRSPRPGKGISEIPAERAWQRRRMIAANACLMQTALLSCHSLNYGRRSRRAPGLSLPWASFFWTFNGSRGYAGRTGARPAGDRSPPGRRAKHTRNMPGGCFTAWKHFGMAAETSPGEGRPGQVP